MPPPLFLPPAPLASRTAHPIPRCPHLNRHCRTGGRVRVSPLTPRCTPSALAPPPPPREDPGDSTPADDDQPVEASSPRDVPNRPPPEWVYPDGAPPSDGDEAWQLWQSPSAAAEAETATDAPSGPELWRTDASELTERPIAEPALPTQVDPPERPPPKWVYPEGEAPDAGQDDGDASAWTLWQQASAAEAAAAAEAPARDPKAETDFWRSAARDLGAPADDSDADSFSTPSQPSVADELPADQTGMWGAARSITGEMSEMQMRLREELDRYNPTTNVDMYRDIARELVGPGSDPDDAAGATSGPGQPFVPPSTPVSASPAGGAMPPDEPVRDASLDDVSGAIGDDTPDAQAGSGWNPDVDWMRFEDMDRVRKIVEERKAREAAEANAAAARDDALSAAAAQDDDDDEGLKVVETTDWETPAWMAEPAVDRSEEGQSDAQEESRESVREKTDWEIPAWFAESKQEAADSDIVAADEASDLDEETEKAELEQQEMGSVEEAEAQEVPQPVATQAEKEDQGDEGAGEYGPEEEPYWMKQPSPEEEASFEWTPPAWATDRGDPNAAASGKFSPISPPPQEDDQQTQQPVPAFIRNRMRSSSAYGSNWSGTKEEIAALEARGETLRDPRADTNSWRAAARELADVPAVAATDTGAPTATDSGAGVEAQTVPDDAVEVPAQNLPIQSDPVADADVVTEPPTDAVVQGLDDQAPSEAGQNDAWSSWRSGAMAWASDNKELKERDTKAEVDMWRSSARELTSNSDAESDASSGTPAPVTSDVDPAPTPAPAREAEPEQGNAWSAWQSGATAWAADNETLKERDAKAEVDMWRSSARELTSESEKGADSSRTPTPTANDAELGSEGVREAQPEQQASGPVGNSGDGSAWDAWRSADAAWQRSISSAESQGWDVADASPDRWRDEDGSGSETDSPDWGSGLDSRTSESQAWAAWNQVSGQSSGGDSTLWFSTRSETPAGRDMDPFAVNRRRDADDPFPVPRRAAPAEPISRSGRGGAVRDVGPTGEKSERIAKDNGVGSWLDFAKEIGSVGEDDNVEKTE